MKVNPTIIASAAALIFAGIAYVQYLKNEDLRVLLEDMHARVASAEDLTDQMNDMQIALATLREDVSAMQQLRGAVSDAGLQTAEPLIQNSKQQSAAQNQSTTPNAYDSRLFTPEAMNARAESQLAMEYGPFIDSLGLPALGRRQLMDVMKAVLVKRLELEGHRRRDEISGTQYSAAVENDMEQELIKHISPEEMEVFYDFEADRPNREREQAINSQLYTLDMRAPGLTEASKSLVAQAMTEVRNSFSVWAVPAVTSDADSTIAEETRQIEMRLDGKLTGEQWELVKEYLQNRKNLAQAYNE